MDSVLGYHTNPLTCGVARFNATLARQIGAPIHQMFSGEALAAREPLLSIKTSEMLPGDLKRLARLAADPAIWPELRLFFHAYSGTPLERRLMARARKVYCGNEALVQELSAHHPDVVQAWCPGMPFEPQRFEPNAEIKIYTFGMAHKLRVDHYHRLHRLLEQSGRSYILYVSSAIHEGTSLDDSFTAAYNELREIFGDRVLFLGFVSDMAVHYFLGTSTFFAAFFETGVRANNTSVSTAMQAGAVVLTNLDDQSPADFRHLESVVDIAQCQDGLPTSPAVLKKIGQGGREAASRLGWAPLLSLFAREEALLGLDPPGARAAHDDYEAEAGAGPAAADCPA